MRTNAEPIKPAPPVTMSFMNNPHDTMPAL
jgi:hypothetical protein